MFSKIAMRQDVFNGCDTAIKVIGVLALIVSGFFALSQFKEGQEREYKKAFYEKQLSTINNLFEVMTDMDTADTKADRDKAVKKFWMIYQGSGRVFLNSKMFEALRAMPVDYVNGCVSQFRKPKIIGDCGNFSASQSMAGFAKVAREEVSQNWERGFEEIGAEDPWIRSK